MGHPPVSTGEIVGAGMTLDEVARCFVLDGDNAWTGRIQEVIGSSDESDGNSD